MNVSPSFFLFALCSIDRFSLSKGECNFCASYKSTSAKQPNLLLQTSLNVLPWLRGPSLTTYFWEQFLFFFKKNWELIRFLGMCAKNISVIQSAITSQQNYVGNLWNKFGSQTSERQWPDSLNIEQVLHLHHGFKDMFRKPFWVLRKQSSLLYKTSTTINPSLIITTQYILKKKTLKKIKYLQKQDG